MSTLYLVATPIGNLEDITLRALRILKEVSLVAAEDTRSARVLFAKYGITTRLTRYDEQGQQARTGPILAALEQGDVALVTDAGMPSVSDPGFGLVRAALERGVRVEVIPGASATLTALAVSGLPTDQFTYLGFLPRKAGERRKLLEQFGAEPRTLILFEAPHRVLATLQDIQTVLGERPVAVCRELTKLHEEVFRGTAVEALAHFTNPRGEFTLVLGGATEAKEAGSATDAAQLLRDLRAQGLTAKQALAVALPRTGLPRRELYKLWLER